jgi:methylthioribose-1-phosphate isomerase
MVTITALSPDHMIASLPIQRLTKSVGRPNYFTLKPLRQEIKENAASIASLSGGGLNGHLGLVASAASYANESATPYVRAVKPGVQPVYPNANPTQFQITEAVRELKEAQREWYEIESLEKALKKQVTAAIEEPYLQAARVGTGLNNVPIYTILEHLFTNYGRLTKKELTDNDAKFRKEWNPDESFELIITQVDDCAEMADTAGNPYTPAQVLNNAYTLVQQTGMFTTDLKEWKRLPDANRTWPAFKQFMVARQIEQMEHATTACGAGYHAANAALLERECENYNNAAKALTNLATATASDRSALAALTNTVQQQTEQIKTKDDLIASLKKQLVDLRKSGNTAKKTAATRTDQGSYCWTHGFHVHKDHNSSNCKFKKPGHQEAATRTNPMGGSMDGDPSKK